MKRSLLALAAGLVLAASVSSQPYGPGPGMMGGNWGPGGFMPGPDMMGGAGDFGMGFGMMGGYSGFGMAPGMMGGYGGFGMGPGMMGGMGAGMMGGMGPGMMAYGPGGCINVGPELTAEQREKLAALRNEFSQRQWALMQKMREQGWQSARANSGRFDEQAARKSFETMAEVRKQMFENSLDMQKRFDALLTPQQREQMRRGPAAR